MGICVSRRELIAGAGAAALCGGACAASVPVPGGMFREKERDIPLDDWVYFPVLVGKDSCLVGKKTGMRAK